MLEISPVRATFSNTLGQKEKGKGSDTSSTSGRQVFDSCSRLLRDMFETASKDILLAFGGASLFVRICSLYASSGYWQLFGFSSKGFDNPSTDFEDVREISAGCSDYGCSDGQVIMQGCCKPNQQLLGYREKNSSFLLVGRRILLFIKTSACWPTKTP